MMNVIDTATGNDTLSRHHDLWVELSRTEMIMETLDRHHDDAQRQQQLQQRCVQLRQAMQRLPG
ncbi:MAG TPA: hypothetical protein VFJ15_02950 [Oleiagrimonas sp.]|nr:hypothetical protein [Oleiagrimonas sp.]